MKILIVHNSYRQLGGEDTVVNQEIKAYAKIGHEVHSYLVTNKELTLLDQLFSTFNIFSALKFRNKVVAFQPDIIHIHNFVFKLSPAILWVIPKRTIVLMTIHNYRFLCPSGTLYQNGKINLNSKAPLGLLKNIFQGIYSDSVLRSSVMALIFRINFLIGTFRKVDHYVFLTPFAKSIHQKWHKKTFSNALVKPNFLVDLEPKKVDKKFDLIFAGRLTEEKGILDVLPILISNSQINILIIGDGPLMGKIKNSSAGHHHIQLMGMQPRENVLELISKSKFLLFPSLWYEGMPMTIIEAFSCGTPVIARNIGAMKSMIDDGTTGFFYSNSNELDHVLRRLNSFDIERLSSNAIEEYLAKYDVNAGMNNLKKMIEQVT